MRFSIDVGRELELKLYQAVLFYRNAHGNRFMATVHGVVQKQADGAPILGAGQLLNTATFARVDQAAWSGLSSGIPFRPCCRPDSRANRLVDEGGGAGHVLP